MSSKYTDRLAAVAQTAVDADPSRQETGTDLRRLTESVDALRDSVRHVRTRQKSFEGETGDAIDQRLMRSEKYLDNFVQHVGAVNNVQYGASDSVSRAGQAYSQLPGLDLSAETEKTLEIAAQTGGLVIAGPLGAVAADKAFDWFMGQQEEQREDAARQVLDQFDHEMRESERKMREIRMQVENEHPDNSPGDGRGGDDGGGSTVDPPGGHTTPPIRPPGDPGGPGGPGGPGDGVPDIPGPGDPGYPGGPGGPGGPGEGTPDIPGPGDPGYPGGPGPGDPGYPRIPGPGDPGYPGGPGEGGPGYPGPGDPGYPGVPGPGDPGYPGGPGGGGDDSVSVDGSVGGSVPGAGGLPTIGAGAGGAGAPGVGGVGGVGAGMGVGGAALGAAAANRLSGRAGAGAGTAGGAGLAAGPGAGAAGGAGGAGARGGMMPGMMGGAGGAGAGKKKRRGGDLDPYLLEDDEDALDSGNLGAGGRDSLDVEDLPEERLDW